MGLKEVAEELKTQIAEAEKVEEKEEVEVEQPKEEPKAEEPKEEPKAEEKPAEPVEELKKTPAEYAKERRDKRAIADELAAANARIAELTKPKEEAPKVAVDAEPSKAEDPQAWNEWALRQTRAELQKTQEDLGRVVEITVDEQKRRAVEKNRQDAEREIANFQAQARQTIPDVDEAAQYYSHMIAASVKMLNPKITTDNLSKAVGDLMVNRAAELFRDGHENPVVAMYEEAKTLGYKKREASNDEGKEVIKPDLAKVAANRARNAGTAAAQGDTGRGELTPKVAATLTNAEFAKLKPEEKKRLFSQLQQAG